MDLERRIVEAYLTEEGFGSLNALLGMPHPDSGVVAFVVESDAFGLWLSPRDATESALGVPWRYLRAIKVELAPGADEQEEKTIGFVS